MMITLPAALSARLSACAQQEDLSVEDLLGQMLDRYNLPENTPAPLIANEHVTLSNGPNVQRDEIPIGRQVHYMVELLEQILIISRANSGKLKFEPQPLSLVPFCESLINDVRVSDENQHQFVFDHQNVPEVVQADGRLLEHILTNLLSNASKYSPIGTTVQLNLTVEEDELVFTVCDEGIGIPDEDTPRLFEPFHRGQNVESVQGTGLGLTIVKQNTELHNGRVTFSTNNHGASGTTFCVYPPLLTEPVHQAGGSLAGNDSTEA